MGKLILGDHIGRGGYGAVFKAKLEPFERDFAIKLLDPSPFHSDRGKVMSRFVREAEILMDLRHQYITPIYGVGEHEGRPFILMEYFEGFNLNQAREKVGSPAPAAILDFFEFVALALGHAHEKGIVHRDIKPGNLMAMKGDARVIDFGIATFMDPAGKRFTKTGGTAVGNIFVAPELTEDPRLVDPRSDIYSLGACWFWLLTGAAPHGRGWEAALEVVEEMDLAYKNVILKTLDQLPQRYSSMDKLVQDIQALRAGSTPNTDGEIDDVAALLLGMVFEDYIPESSPVSSFTLKQELTRHASSFAFSMSVKTLRSRQFVEALEMTNMNGDEWTAYSITAAGEDWVASNRSRVEQLMVQAENRTFGGPPF